MHVIEIGDPSDPRVADFRALPDPERLRSSGVFVAEGRLVVERLLLESALCARAVLVTPAAFASLRDTLARRVADVQVFVADQDVLNAIGGFNFHRGCLALGERPPGRDVEWLLDARLADGRSRRAQRIVVLEGVSNADNVGGIFRSAAALAADGVLLGPGCCDPLYRKAVRTSIGASLVLPFAIARQWPGDLDAIRTRGFRIVALTPASEARVLEEATELRDCPALALLAGAEGAGLTAAALDLADERVRIPMKAGVDSLNVTVAVSIALDRLVVHGRP